MKFVLDTNAVSEMAKPWPNQGLVNWHLAQNAADLFVTQSHSLKFGKASTACTQPTVNMIELSNLLLDWQTCIAS